MDYKMVVTCGKPLKTSDSTVLTISWDECVNECWNDPNCVLVYDTSPTCNYYSIEQITTVQKLTASSKSRVAFRLLSRNKTCTDDKEEPILKNGTVQSDVQRDASAYTFNQYLPINITLKNNVWTFTQRSEPFTCFPRMEPIRRGGAIWCMQVGTSGSCMNRTFANQMCKASFQQPLAGPANAAEYQYLETMANSYLSNFVDPNALNPTLKWLAGQPDGLPQKTNADCVYYFARNNSQSGIDDMLCQNAVFSHQNICMVGYYCGSRLGPDTWT
ncbi:Protein CBG06627 [Caenorhabditis briggsae]|uniref:Protein CBG06627 n=1 Tax=Caenorhabditis briggsae TaxID=6238 RepID=A8X2P9_CAEBR|nr:Protein CBG06627 [Caenorhabditis briggsae]CAP26909.2 Protein CBG06627 [Caenorhabditis briggsae]